MKHTVIFLILVTLCFTSCVGPLAPKEHMLSTEAHQLNPYQMELTLVFESNNKQLDSIHIKGITKAMTKGGDPFSFAPDTFENYRVNYTSATSKAEKGLIYVGWFDEHHDVRFELELGHSRLFCQCSFTSAAFDSIPNTTFTALNKTLTDIKVLHSDAYYEDRSHRVLNFYWSTSTGLLGWDTPSSTWRLKEIIYP